MIGLNQHRKGFTQQLVATFSDRVGVKSGFGAFFPDKTTRTKGFSIEVERLGKKVAVDVQRCTDPIRNKFSKSTEKIFIPPMYSLSFDFTACESYDVTFGMGTVPNEITGTSLLQSADAKLTHLKDQIERAKELQRAQILQTGIVVLKNGDNIDFKRKAESFETLTGTARWTVSADCDPVKDLQDGCEFLRNTGRSGASTVNAIMGSTAFNNFKLSAKVKAEADIRNINRTDIQMPMMDNVSGLVFQGQVGAGDFIVNLWTYNETYEDADNNEVRYLDANKVILLPSDFQGFTGHGALPAVLGNVHDGQYVGNVEATYEVHDVIDPKKMSWEYILNSAPLAVPLSVDRIYTLTTTSAS